MLKSFVSLTNKNFKKKKIINFNLGVDSFLNKDVVNIYDGLKDYEVIENVNYIYFDDLRKDLVILDRYKHKFKINSLSYSSFFFPKNTIKSRYIYSFSKVKNNYLLDRFDKLIRLINKNYVLNLIDSSCKQRQTVRYSIRNYTVLKVGNYNSGYIISALGLVGLFLYYTKICLKSKIFTTKKMFFESDYSFFEKKFIFSIRNSLNRLNYFIKQLANLNKFDRITVFKKFYREFKFFKLMFRFYFVSRKKIIFNRFAKFRLLKKTIRLLYYIYDCFIKKVYRKVFVLFFGFIKNNFIFNKDYSIIYSLSNFTFYNNNNHNLNFDNSIFAGNLYNFSKGAVSRVLVKKQDYFSKKLFKFYKLFLNTPKKLIYKRLLFDKIKKKSVLFDLFLNKRFGFNNLNYLLYRQFNFKYFKYYKKYFSGYNYKRLLTEGYKFTKIIPALIIYSKKKKKKKRKPYWTRTGMIYRIWYKVLERIKNKVNHINRKKKYRRSYLFKKLFKLEKDTSVNQRYKTTYKIIKKNRLYNRKESRLIRPIYRHMRHVSLDFALTKFRFC